MGIIQDAPDGMDTRRGVFLVPMSHAFAEKLIADLGAVALQLGETGQEFYNGLVKGWEAMEQGAEGLPYDSKD